MAASKAAGGGEAGVRAATALNQPTQGPSNATIDPKAVQADLQRANAMASNPASGKTPNRPADAPKTPTELTSTPGAGRDDLMKRQAAAAKNEAYDAYDLVLEYLFDNGHVDTVEEAHYIMMEMDPETVGNICEAKKPKKWIQGTHMKKGALHKQLGIPEDEKIPAEMLTKAAKEPGKLGRRARFAQTLKGLHKEEE